MLTYLENAIINYTDERRRTVELTSFIEELLYVYTQKLPSEGPYLTTEVLHILNSINIDSSKDFLEDVLDRMNVILDDLNIEEE